MLGRSLVLEMSDKEFVSHRCNRRCGCGLFNKFLNCKRIPELHAPSYQFLGPFTNLEKRLKRGDQGINPLDCAAKEHDIFYSTHSDVSSRHTADKQLENRAWERVLAPDSSLSEKVAAYLTTNAMKIKQKMGMGLKNKSGRSLHKVRRKKKRSTKKRSAPTFGSLVRKAKIAVKGVKEKDIRDESTLKQKVQLALKAIGSRKGVLPTSSKIIPIPKSGGMLPPIPLITGISKKNWSDRRWHQRYNQCHT